VNGGLHKKMCGVRAVRGFLQGLWCTHGYKDSHYWLHVGNKNEKRMASKKYL
jgi:hypothetical protein